MTSIEQEQVKAGFELDGDFYRWHVTDTGKDLLLIDRFSGLPINEFFELIEDVNERGRAPIILAMMATSIRAEHPTWSVERIVHMLQDTSLSEVAFVSGEAEDESPPAEGAPEAPTSTSSADESSPSSTPEDNSPSPTLHAIQA